MRFAIIVAPDAAEAIQALDAHIRSEVRDQIAVHLTFEPEKVSKSRIKRLRGLRQPQYRLRVGDIRVFYDVVESEVHVLAVVEKAEASKWLEEQGSPE